MGMFMAKKVDFSKLQQKPLQNITSSDARGFAVAGGVAQAVVNAARKIDPSREIKVVAVQGLDNCKKLLKDAKFGKYDGYLLEGMACPYGCASGAGTIQPPTKTRGMVELSKREATKKNTMETEFLDRLHDLV